MTNFSPYPRDYPPRKPECSPFEHQIIDLLMHEYEEPYKELHPYKCTKCGTTFGFHSMELVNGNWQLIDFSKRIKTRKRSARRRSGFQGTAI